jgi:hypothetical protein
MSHQAGARFRVSSCLLRIGSLPTQAAYSQVDRLFWRPAGGRSNPTRVTQIAAIYTTATVFFLTVSDIWSYSGPVMAVLIGAPGGGFAGAHLARHLSSGVLRGIVLTTAITMTVGYFLRG